MTIRSRHPLAAAHTEHAADAADAENAANAEHTESSQDTWWRHAVIYQIYVRSFADSDGDGIGDLRGIVEHLDHVVTLGADAVWLTPFYPSPLRDGGYDVADYRDVDPRLGTLADFDALLARAHELGLKVIIDIVPNHTSSAHPWFVEALASPPGSPARARYIFRRGQGPHGELPPSNWRSTFGGPAWEPVGDGEWYLHLFDVSQPDLNWDNPQVREEFDSILRFWLDRGVDGFRIDVAHGLAKDLSEPLRAIDPRYSQGAAPAGTQDHPHWDRDDVHEIYRHWRTLLDSYSPPRMACAEAWVDSAARRARYVRHDELHQAFNFDFLQTPWEASAMRATIDESLQASADVGSTTTWVLSNHDVMREVTRYALPPSDGESVPWAHLTQAPPVDVALGLRRARAAVLLLLGLPGSAYVYQGEELGLPEVLDLPEEALADPVWERSGHTERGRDGARVPIPWTTEPPSFGFSPPHATRPPWLPMPDWFGSLSIAAQTGVEGSTLELYRSALRLRREYGGDLPMSWADDAPQVLRFRLASGLAVQVNMSSQPVPIAPGRLRLASGPLDGGLLPPDTAVWVDQSA